jgi:hypothetical protein
MKLEESISALLAALSHKQGGRVNKNLCKRKTFFAEGVLLSCIIHSLLEYSREKKNNAIAKTNGH